MSRLTSTYILPALAVPLVALAVAGCGGGGGAGNSSPAGGHATVNVAKTNLGNVLVDRQGHTLYLFKKDSGAKSSCFGACAVDWPPVRAAATPSVGGGLTSAKAMSFARSDGKPGVLYNGHPLYRFAGDQKPGDVGGQGLSEFGGKWYAVSANGQQVVNMASSSPSSSSGGYGGGY
jgi:predicted lipoprotein with Yx(FWY)xxD motif